MSSRGQLRLVDAAHRAQSPAVGVGLRQRQRRHHRIGNRGARVPLPAPPRDLPRVVRVGEGDEQQERLVGPVASEVMQLALGRERDLLVEVGLHRRRAHARVQHALHRVVPGQRLVQRAAPVGRPIDVGGIDVGGQPLLEPVQLVGSDEVHLARHGGVIAGGAQRVGDGRHGRRQARRRCHRRQATTRAGRSASPPARGRTADRRSRRCHTRSHRAPARPDAGSGPPGGRTPAATTPPADRPSAPGSRAASREPSAGRG